MNMITVSIATEGQFFDSREKWNQLVQAMPYPSVFCTWEWISAWQSNFTKKNNLFIIFVYEGGDLIGILPLYYYQSDLIKTGFCGKVLKFCGADPLHTDHLDVICNKENTDICIEAIFKYLNNNRSLWDVIHIPLLAENSGIISYFNQKTRILVCYIYEITTAPYLVIGGKFDDYINKFKKKKRYNIRRERKKLYNELDAGYFSCNNNEEVIDGLRTVFHLHNKRFAHKGTVSTFGNKNIEKFYLDFIENTGDRDYIWIRFIRNKERVVSAFLGFYFCDRIFFYQMGHDPEYSNYSLGSTIIYESINEAFQKKCVEFNFLQGDEQYKYSWTDKERMLSDVVIFNRTINGLLSLIMSRIRRMMSNIKNKLRQKNLRNLLDIGKYHIV